MTEVELGCAVYGEGAVFPVKIARDAKVSALQKAIFVEKRHSERYKFVASDLTLYLARKEGGAWLKDNDSIDTLLQGDVDAAYTQMRPLWRLSKKELFGPDFLPGEEEIHVLVELPPSAGIGPRQQSGLWLLRGEVENALSTIGVRCRLYCLAGSYLGYYDPARRIGDKNIALWYEGNTLCIHILFETKDNALRFENAVRDESVTLGSPLNGQNVTTSVTPVDGVPAEKKRIYSSDYDPEEWIESPQGTMPSISQSESVTVVDSSTDEFRFQRIEHEKYFLPYGKAESCHLVPKKHCMHRDFKQEFDKYNHDANNRLALSREMHGFYDGLSMEVPIVNILPGSVNRTRFFDNRYKVDVFVKVFDMQCIDRVFSRLKEGAEKTDDPLVMKTFVYVVNPETFCFCLKWKYDENDESWSSFLSMTPAVD